MSTSEKYLFLCAKNGEKPTALAEKLGFSRATGTKWCNGGGMSKTARIAVADYFGVPLEYFEDEKLTIPLSPSSLSANKEIPTTTKMDGMSDRHILLTRLFDSLPVDYQDSIIAQLQVLAQSRKGQDVP